MTTSHADHATVVETATPRKKGTTPQQDLTRGIWRENPVLIQVLGLCPTLAVTNTVANSIAMGVATMIVLLGSSVFVAALRKFIPGEVRITSYILIIATFVSIVDYGLAAMFPDLSRALGAFIALIVVNCIILGRQEAFSAKNTVWRSALDAVGTGIGFMIALLMMGAIRELLGSGSLLGFDVMGPSFEPWVIMVLPPGGFFTLGWVLLAYSWWAKRKAARPTRRWIHPVALEPAGAAASTTERGAR